MKGTLEVITGCMSCGKSEELIRRARREQIAKREVIIFKPAMDTRTDSATVASRDGKKIKAIALPDVSQALWLVTNKGESFTSPFVVCFDEAQFFQPELSQVVDSLVLNGYRVIVAGLDTDFRGEPFEQMANLLAKADRVDKLTAICMQCGGTATRTQRLINGAPAPYTAPRIQVGGDEMYEARCRDCHAI